MKKKILFIGIDMRCAGTEKSFISYLNRYDPNQFDITLLLAKKQGELLSEIPKYVKIKEMPRPYGDIFLLDHNNAVKVLLSSIIIHHPIASIKLLPEIMRVVLKKPDADTMVLWCKFMKLMPEFEGHFDEAIAYWGEKTMFYMLEKVDADIKAVRQHFSYTGTRHADAIYYEAYKKCDRIEHVAKVVDDEFRSLFPELAEKAVFIPNLMDRETILRLAETGEGFNDGYTGKRILTVSRLCYQKGLDIAANAIKFLSRCMDVRWYIIGSGVDREKLLNYAKENGIEDRIILLGQRENPYTYIKQCDVYLQPSRFEGKPLTVEEAKILEKPIVASDYLSAEEQLEGYNKSIICRQDAVSLSYGIITMLNLQECV